MNTLRRILLTGTAVAATILHAGSYEQAARYLDLDGDLVGFVNFDGDGAAIGSSLNEIYADFLVQNPQMVPVPLDFVQIFDTLGFGSVRAIGFSGKELEDGFFCNRAVYLLEGEPAGLFALYGDADDYIAGFRAAEDAPADASYAISGTFQLSVLREVVVAIMSQIMGPMGEAMVAQQTGQLVPGTDISFDELIDALGGRIDAVWKQELGSDKSQTVSVRLRFYGAGSLLDRLRSLSAMMPIDFETDDTGLTADFSASFEGSGIDIGMFLHVPAGSDDLLLYTDPEWTVEGAGSLAASESFRRYAGGLPEEAIFFSYSAGANLDEVLASMEQIPNASQFVPLAGKVVDLLLGGFMEPNASATIFQDDAMISVQYAGFSAKQAVIAFPAAIGGGLMAAMAIPAFQKVRQTAQEKTVVNNLRMIASAAHQHFLETGETEVTFEQLVGPDAYIREIEPVAGEVYEGLVITLEMSEISVTLGDGRVISTPF